MTELATLLDPLYLPTHEEVRAVCTSYEREEIRRLGHGYTSIAFDDFEALFPYEDAFEVLTREFIASLGGHVASQIVQRDLQEPCVILELGAGTGRLAYFLKRELKSRVPGRFNFYATDNGEWSRIHDQFGMVEPLDFDEALQKYKPHIVLVSWMPYQVDWSKAIRLTPTVEEYILIGEDGGCVGCEWDTWGQWMYEDEEPDEVPWLTDGFVQTLLCEVTDHQINRRSRSRSSEIRSRTFSFRRMPRDGVG